MVGLKSNIEKIRENRRKWEEWLREHELTTEDVMREFDAVKNAVKKKGFHG